VLSLCTAVEVEMVGSVKLVDSVPSQRHGHHLDEGDSPVLDILACMGVHDVEKNGQTHLVSRVDQRLELLGCTWLSAKMRSA
jgi:hypothetical protein